MSVTNFPNSRGNKQGMSSHAQKIETFELPDPALSFDGFLKYKHFQEFVQARNAYWLKSYFDKTSKKRNHAVDANRRLRLFLPVTFLITALYKIDI